MNATESGTLSKLPSGPVASSAILRVGFWLSCLTLVLGYTLLVSLPTSRMTSSQALPLALAGESCSILAIALCVIGKGRRSLKFAGALVGLPSAVVWMLTIFFTSMVAGWR